MATDKDVAKLKRDMSKLKAYLRDQLVWEQRVTKSLRRLKQENSLTGPTVTEPPKPPRP
jgi:hypothetical protein